MISQVCHPLINKEILGRSSFNNIKRWLEDVRTERGHEVILVIVGNKTDLEDRYIQLLLGSYF
jgi:GTPase SAR1 family protein